MRKQRLSWPRRGNRGNWMEEKRSRQGQPLTQSQSKFEDRTVEESPVQGYLAVHFAKQGRIMQMHEECPATHDLL